MFDRNEEDMFIADFTDRAAGKRMFVEEFFFKFSFEVVPSCSSNVSIGAIWVKVWFRKIICRFQENKLMV